MAYLASSTCLILFALAASIGTVLSDCAALDQYFYIRNKVSGEVLDTSQRTGIRMMDFEGDFFQRFKLRPASTLGLFNIHAFFSIKSESVLTYKPVEEFTATNLSMQAADGSIYQEWYFNGDGTIMSAAFPNYGLKSVGTYLALVDATNFGPEETFHFTDAALYP